MEETAYEYLRGWYSSRNIIYVIKPGAMNWAGHVIARGRRRNVCRVSWGNLTGMVHLEGVDGR